MTTNQSSPPTESSPPTQSTWPEPLPLELGPNGDRTPLARNDNIQGNILAGFNKDHQMLLFLSLPAPDEARAWLAELRPQLASNEAVASFNQRFSAAHHEAGSDPEDLAAVWTNVSFTAAGIRLLAPAAIAPLSDPGVDAGIALWLAEPGDAEVAATIGDTGSSAPSAWLFGQPGQTVHALLCVAADRPADLNTEIAKQHAAAARHGVSIVFEQPGETLPGAAAGHEHFGFKDGISQPGVFGFDPPATDARHKGQVKGKPGTDLIAPGTFVLGYRRDPERETGLPETVNVPRWMFDGSFLTTRRLAQDVAGFWSNVEQAHAALPATAKCPMTGIVSPDALAAKLVGRWRSGTPVDAAPFADNRSAHDPAGDNDFDFGEDLGGDRTPFAAHIRKVYPREGGAGPDVQIKVTEDGTKPRRIMRRGIPFGLPFQPTAGRGAGVDGERGLVFQCYQASLKDQFAFLQQAWVNFGRFPTTGTGNDPVIGLASDVRVRACGADRTVGFGQFVRTQGSLFHPHAVVGDDRAAGGRRTVARRLTGSRGSTVATVTLTEVLADPDRRAALAGDPDAIYDAFTGWAGGLGLELYPAQSEALIEIVSGANVILATPTGSGKSLVATGGALHCAGGRSALVLHGSDQGPGQRDASSPCARCSAPSASA